MISIVKKNFRNRTKDLLMKIYNTHVLPKLSYCSQMWHTGRETHLKSIVKEMEKYWKLSLSKSPPDNYLWPKEQLIMNDLVLMHKIYHGKSVLKFESLFKMSTYKQHLPQFR